MNSFTQKEKNMGIVQMVACSVLWSIAGIFIKLIPWNGLVIAGIRSGIASLTILVYFAFAKLKVRMNKRILLHAICLGSLCSLFVMANKLTTAANAIIIQYTCPIFLMLITGIVLKQKLRGMDILSSVLTFAGVGLCFIEGIEGGHIAGNLVALSTGVLMALMLLCSGNGSEEERMNGILWGHFFAFLIGLPAIIITPPEITFKPVFYIVILGIFQLGIPYILLIRASKTCSPLACSLISSIEPLLNPMWVAIFDGEMPGPMALIGGIIVIVSVTLWCVLDYKKGKELQGTAID